MLVTKKKNLPIRAGDPTPFLQPDGEITIDEYGVMRGTAVFEFDSSLLPILTPQVGIDVHPKDSRLTCYEVNVRFSRQGKAQVSASYIGLLFDPSPPKIEFSGGSGQDPIETHPDFIEFAGTPENPKNGAVFDDETKEFQGFFDKKNAPQFAGIRSYIVPSVTVNYSYYTTSTPSVSSVGKIYSGVPGFRSPPNVKNYLLVGMPYRQTANIYFVTKQFLGSGDGGWNRTIY